MYDLALVNTTTDEVLRRLPAARVVTSHASQQLGFVLASVDAASHEEAVTLAVQARLTVALAG